MRKKAKAGITSLKKPEHNLMKPKECDHPVKCHVIVFVKTEVDHRPMPRFKCTNCGKIGNVIYKINPITGNPVLTR